MHLFFGLLLFMGFSLIGHAYHAYGCIPAAGIGGTMRKSEAGKVCIT